MTQIFFYIQRAHINLAHRTYIKSASISSRGGTTTTTTAKRATTTRQEWIQLNAISQHAFPKRSCSTRRHTSEQSRRLCVSLWCLMLIWRPPFNYQKHQWILHESEVSHTADGYQSLFTPITPTPRDCRKYPENFCPYDKAKPEKPTWHSSGGDDDNDDRQNVYFFGSQIMFPQTLRTCECEARNASEHELTKATFSNWSWCPIWMAEDFAREKKLQPRMRKGISKFYESFCITTVGGMLKFSKWSIITIIEINM